MKTLIVYASTHGFTGRCARRMGDELLGEVVVKDLAYDPDPPVAEADLVVIGGSIHMGKVQAIVSSFCDRHREALLRRQLGLFLCCMKENAEASEQFENAFPLRLRAHASCSALLGGAFDFERLNALQRLIVKRVAGVHASTERLDESSLRGFVAQLNHLVLGQQQREPAHN